MKVQGLCTVKFFSKPSVFDSGSFSCSRRHIPEPEVVYERGEEEDKEEEEDGKEEEEDGEEGEGEEEEEGATRLMRHVHHIAPSSSERYVN